MLDSMEPGSPRRDTDAAIAPSAGTMILRGLAWGAALGCVAGFVLPAATELLMDQQVDEAASSLLLGVFTGPIGLLFGAVTGAVVAACCIPLADSRHPTLGARAVAAVIGPVVVVLLSLALFRPRFEIGANQTRSHLVETVLVFVALPALAAFVAAVLFADRLVKPETARPAETSDIVGTRPQSR